MGVYDEINIIITGQVDADMASTKRQVIAELEMVCAKYDLELTVRYKEE